MNWYVDITFFFLSFEMYTFSTVASEYIFFELIRETERKFHSIYTQCAPGVFQMDFGH